MLRSFRALAAGITFLTMPSAAATLFTANLTGAQEVPSNSSPATGTGTFVLNDAQTELTFDITYAGLIGGTVSGAHFHNAPPGVNGPIVRGVPGPLDVAGTFGTPNGSISGVWRSSDPQPLTPALISELFGGNIYFNIHTSDGTPPDFPGGEIRGQLTTDVPEPLSIWLLGTGLAVLKLRRRVPLLRRDPIL